VKKLKPVWNEPETPKIINNNNYYYNNKEGRKEGEKVKEKGKKTFVEVSGILNWSIF
jgi:hypothetical protein